MSNIAKVIAAGVLALSYGCADFSKLNNFAFKNQKAQAQQKWDSVRADVKLQLVRQHLEAGRIGEAEKALDQVIALTPHDARPFVLATRLRLEQGKQAEAKEAIDIALVMQNADAETYYWAGVVAQRYSDLTSALNYYEVASNKAPLVPAYVAAQAEMLLALDRPADGLQLIASRLIDFDGDVTLRVLAARTARSLSVRSPAVKYAREAIFMSRGDRVIIAQVAEILNWAHADQEIIEAIAPLMNAQPPVATSLQCILAQAYLRSGSIAEARAVLQNLNDEGGVMLLISARAALAGGDLQGAARLAQASMDHEHGRKSAEAYLIIGYFSLHSSDARNAIAMAQDALNLEPKSVEAMCLKGQAYEVLGEIDEARWSYLDALSAAPSNPLPKGLLDKLSLQTPVESTESAKLPTDRVSIGDCGENDPCAGEAGQ